MGVTAAAVHDYGDRALLLEFGTTAEVLAWTEALRAAELPGVVDLVPAAQTVLMILADSGCQAPVRQRIGRVTPDADSIADAGSPPDEADVVLHVTYDGADLDEVARLTGLSVDEVVAAHTGRPWRVGFCGFAPGFGYLLDGDERLQVPRRANPGPRCPSVRSRSRVRSAASTPGNRPVAGSSSGEPTRRCGTSIVTNPRC